MRAYQDMVFSTAARLTGEESQAQDIAQEVFLRAYENFGSLCASATAGGWLKTVTTNLTLNHLSRYRRRWRFFSELHREDGGGDGIGLDFEASGTLLDRLAEEERNALVEEGLRNLPEHQRVPLVLYHFEGMSYRDIAQRLKISLSKVKTDILRARAALIKKLTRS